MTWEAPLCNCGCGEKVKWNKSKKRWNKFIKGHERRGWKWSEEVKEKMSKSRMGYKMPEETKQKLREANLGKTHSDAAKEKMSKSHKKWFIEHPNSHPMLGKTHSDEAKEKISAHSIELWADEEYKKHMSELMKKRYEDPNERLRTSLAGKGKKRSEETRKKMSDGMKELCKDPSRHPSWKGGLSAEPYCWDWSSPEFKEMIKARDGYKCQNPDCWHTCDVKLTIHHIDYIKKNCDPMNLITVCSSCNSRANGKRDVWKSMYQKMMSYRFKEDGFTKRRHLIVKVKDS